MTTNTEHRRRETDKIDQVCMKYQLEKANKRIAELELADAWTPVVRKMPAPEQVVLIHVTALGIHGVVSAWFSLGGQWPDNFVAEWVALDDAITYRIDEVDFWRYSVPLPPPPAEKQSE